MVIQIVVYVDFVLQLQIGQILHYGQIDPALAPRLVDALGQRDRSLDVGNRSGKIGDVRASLCLTGGVDHHAGDLRGVLFYDGVPLTAGRRLVGGVTVDLRPFLYAVHIDCHADFPRVHVPLQAGICVHFLDSKITSHDHVQLARTLGKSGKDLPCFPGKSCSRGSLRSRRIGIRLRCLGGDAGSGGCRGGGRVDSQRCALAGNDRRKQQYTGQQRTSHPTDGI